MNPGCFYFTVARLLLTIRNVAVQKRLKDHVVQFSDSIEKLTKVQMQELLIKFHGEASNGRTGVEGSDFPYIMLY